MSTRRSQNWLVSQTTFNIIRRSWRSQGLKLQSKIYSTNKMLMNKLFTIQRLWSFSYLHPFGRETEVSCKLVEISMTLAGSNQQVHTTILLSHKSKMTTLQDISLYTYQYAALTVPYRHTTRLLTYTIVCQNPYPSHCNSCHRKNSHFNRIEISIRYWFNSTIFNVRIMSKSIASKHSNHNRLSKWSNL